MKSDVTRLRDELDEAKETIRQLRDAMTPASGGWRGLRLSPRQHVVLHALCSVSGPVSRERLRARMDAFFGLTEPGNLKSVDVTICQLRAKLRTLDPPVLIRTVRYEGYQLDTESRSILAALREG